MKTIEITFTILFAFGVIALIYTIFKYPLDIFRGLFVDSGSRFRLITFPIWIPIWVLDQIFEWGLWPDKEEKSRGELGQEKKDIVYPTNKRIEINFPDFKKFVFVYSTDEAKIRREIKEAEDSFKGLNISGYDLIVTEYFAVIQLPSMDFYGFSYLIQWLDTNLNNEVFGFAKANTMSFFVYQDSRTLNNLIGQTNKKQNFSISMYDDLNTYPELRLSKKIEIEKKVTNNLFEELLKTRPITQ